MLRSMAFLIKLIMAHLEFCFCFFSVGFDWDHLLILDAVYD